MNATKKLLLSTTILLMSAQAKAQVFDGLKLEMEKANRAGDWQAVSKIQYGELPELESQLKEASKIENKAQKKL